MVTRPTQACRFEGIYSGVTRSATGFQVPGDRRSDKILELRNIIGDPILFYFILSFKV